jgi:prepilin-type N-terminal cleavage/methylation domain-containing protein
MRNRKAFSVVEVLVALVVFSVAALGCAAAVGIAARVQREAIARRAAVNALELRLASLSTMPCETVTDAAGIINEVPVLTRVTRTDSLATYAVTAIHGATTTTLRMEVPCD